MIPPDSNDEELKAVKCDYGRHWHYGTEADIEKEVKQCQEEVKRIFGE